MKFFSISLIALFFLGLCLVEKESKKHALEEARHVQADLINNYGYNQNAPEASFVSSKNGNDTILNFKLQKSVTSDSTSTSDESLSFLQ